MASWWSLAILTRSNIPPSQKTAPLKLQCFLCLQDYQLQRTPQTKSPVAALPPPARVTDLPATQSRGPCPVGLCRLLHGGSLGGWGVSSPFLPLLSLSSSLSAYLVSVAVFKVTFAALLSYSGYTLPKQRRPTDAFVEVVSLAGDILPSIGQLLSGPRCCARNSGSLLRFTATAGYSLACPCPLPVLRTPSTLDTLGLIISHPASPDCAGLTTQTRQAPAVLVMNRNNVVPRPPENLSMIFIQNVFIKALLWVWFWFERRYIYMVQSSNGIGGGWRSLNSVLLSSCVSSHVHESLAL